MSLFFRRGGKEGSRWKSRRSSERKRNRTSSIEKKREQDISFEGADDNDAAKKVAFPDEERQENLHHFA